MTLATPKRLDYPLDIRLLVSTPIEEQFRIHACAKEPWTVQFIESMPAGSVLYDIGANVGPYSLLAAALGHTVVAIEPSYANYARLCENILLNEQQTRIIPLPLALSDRSGILTLPQDPRPGYSGGNSHLRVPCVQLNQLVGPGFPELPQPTHIKLDIDGWDAERAALDGAGRVLKQGVSLLAELSTTQDQGARMVLEHCGYTLAQEWRTREGSKMPDLKGVYYGLWLKQPALVET